MLVNIKRLPSTKFKPLFIAALSATLVIGSAHPLAAQTPGGNSPAYSQEVLRHLTEGDKLIRASHGDQAAKEYQGAISADSHCPDAYNQLGLVYMHKGEMDKAAD